MRTKNFTRIALASAFVLGMQVTNAQDATTEWLPSTAAPIPTQAATDVLPIFTDAYPDAVGVSIQEGTGGTTCTASIIDFAENDQMISVIDLNGGAGGLDFSRAVDVTEYDSLHFDVYMLKKNANANEIEKIQVLLGGIWSSTIPGLSASAVDAWNPIDLSIDDFTSRATEQPALDNLQTRAFWFRRDGGGTRSFMLDNIYFYGYTGKGPGTGIASLSAQDQVAVSTQGNTVMLSSDVAMESIQVYSLSGQHVMTLQDAGQSAIVSLEAEQAGIYLFNVALANGETVVKKILNM